MLLPLELLNGRPRLQLRLAPLFEDFLYPPNQLARQPGANSAGFGPIKPG
jgi:hypothetical protein